MKQVFITGASGCIGHYIVESLLINTNHQLYLLVRNPKKLKLEWLSNPRINILQGDMDRIQDYSDLLLKKINIAILIATSWGGNVEAYNINVVKTLLLLEMLNPKVCERVFYFSTASVLDRNNQLLPEANELGTEYIRTKYNCLSRLSRLEISDRMTVLFPTLVFGGDNNKPLSHLTSGLPEVVKWIKLISWFKTEGSFHFIHARDIAGVVTYLIDRPQVLEDKKRPIYLVLGSPAITVNRAINEVSKYFDRQPLFKINLYPWLINFFIKVFNIKTDSWSYFSLNYRHFVYKNPITPATFGLKNYCSSLTDILKEAGQ